MDSVSAPVYVIKVWSNVFLHEQWIYEDVFENLINCIVYLKSEGVQPVIISSWAIVLGELHLEQNSEELSHFEYECLCASVGQPKLFNMYQSRFDKHNIYSSQILVTYEDMQDFGRPTMIKMIIDHNLKRGIIPIINENNTVFMETQNKSNNDKLAMFIAEMLRPEKCIILTNVDGLLDAHPDDGGNLIPIVSELTDEYYSFVDEKKSITGRWGMRTKLDAAARLLKLRIPMYLANGKQKGVLSDIHGGKKVGTYFRR